jgi:predicted nucleic acid-binding protein
LISSEALLFKVRRNPNPIRKRYAAEALSLAKTFIKINEAVENRANALNALGIKPLNALHLASAKEAQANYFCTCDERDESDK